MLDLKNLENKKIELNNTNFMFFEKYFLTELFNGYIQKIQQLNTTDFFLKIKIRKEGKNKDLIVGQGLCFLSENKTETMKENKGLSLFLNKQLENKKILNIKQINLEKILLFEFENFNLYFEFFSKNNIIFTNKNNEIITQLLKEQWKDRNIKRNEIYSPPKNLTSVLEFSPSKEIYDENKNIVSNIIKNVNIHPKLVEKYLEYKKINKDEKNYSIFEETILIFKNYYKNTNLNLCGFILEDKFVGINLNLDFLENCNFNLNDFLNKNFEKTIFKTKNISLNIKEKQIKNVESILNEQKNAYDKILNKANKNKDIGDFIYNNYILFEELKQKIKTNKIKENDVFKINNYSFLFKKIDKRKQKIVFSIL